MRTAILGLFSLALASSAFAVPFTAIRIGDADGFGFTTDVPGLTAANGAGADSNGNGVLEQTEFLPDLNGDGNVQVTAAGSAIGRDEFDNRSLAELAGASITGGGFSDTGSTGSDFTDISLTQSYDAILGLGGVYVSPGNPGPNVFPAPPSATLPNQPGFEFRFDVAKADIDSSQSIFFNVLFGDYDIVPADIDITTNNGANGAGAVITLPLAVQPLGQDGLIQGSFVNLGFFDVFSDGGAVWNGFLNVDFDAALEPYTAFDFVELSTDPISPQPVPEPGTLALLGSMLLAGFGLHRRRIAG